MSARVAAAVAVFALSLVALAAVGRWEGSRHARSELDRMAEIRALVGPLDNSSLRAYRLQVDLKYDCLLYERLHDPYALELCFDQQGRLVEAIDRRGNQLEIGSLREEPERSTIRVDRDEVDRLLRRLGAPIR